MISHYMTKYHTNDGLRFCSWLQFNFFGKVYCFSKKEYLVKIIGIPEKNIEKIGDF